jgi:hypothetical protein
MLGKVDDAQISFVDRRRSLPSRWPVLACSFCGAIRASSGRACRQQHPDNQDVQGLYGTFGAPGIADRPQYLAESGRLDPIDTAGARTMAVTVRRRSPVRGADFAQADRLYRRAVLLDPLNRTAAAGLARVFVQGETNAALLWAKRAVAIEPRDAALHVMLGDVHEGGDLNAARTEWKTACDIDPHSYRAASRMPRREVTVSETFKSPWSREFRSFSAPAAAHRRSMNATTACATSCASPSSRAGSVDD